MNQLIQHLILQQLIIHTQMLQHQISLQLLIIVALMMIHYLGEIYIKKCNKYVY